MKEVFKTILDMKYVRVVGVIAILLLAAVLISNGTQTNRMINVLEEHYGHTINDEDVIDVIEREDETLIFHKGYNDKGEYPVYILSYLEKNGFKWIYRGAYYDSQVIDEMEEYYSTISFGDAGDDDYRLITGVVKGSEY